MDYLNVNLSFLKNKYPHLYDLLIKYQANTSTYQRIEMSGGLGNVIVSSDMDTNNTCYLYPNVNTLYEFALWVQSAEEKVAQHDHILLYGLGLGYHLRLLLEHYPSKWVYVYEPDINMFYTAMKSEDLRGLLNHPRVKAVAVGSSQEEKRQLVYPICTLANGTCAFAAIPFYENEKSILIEQFFEEFPVIVTEYNVHQSTMIRFKDEWMRNRLYHLSTNLLSHPLAVFKNHFSDYPALIVGSGPSLQLDIQVVQKLKDRCLIIAAGSSVQALLHHNITPHLVVIIDGGNVVENIFHEPESLRIPMLYTPTTNYKITDRTQALRIYANDDTDPVTRYFIQPTVNDPILRSLASVSGTAVQAAIYLGCKEIIFAGQDFSFPEEKHYTEGIAHIPSNVFQQTVTTAESVVENVNGGTNRTTLPYRILKKNMEEIIRSYPEVKFINTSRIGAKIAETEWVAIEALNLLWQNQERPLLSSSCFNDIEGAVIQTNTNQKKELQEQITSVLLELDNIRQKLKGIKNQLSKLAELSRKHPLKCSNTMENIEEEWSFIANSELFSVLFEPLLPAELQFFDSHLSLIIEEQNIIPKSKYFETYLGKIVLEMIQVIPNLEQLIKEALQRISN